MNKNCPNCGAPYDNELTKCPYCGTSYVDMSFIDFDEGEPFYLKIKMNGTIVTQFVKPVFGDMTVEYDPIYAYGPSVTPIIAYNRGPRAITNISFEAIPDRKNHNTLTMIKKEN